MAFDNEEMKQLKDLFEQQDIRLVAYLDERFTAQDTRIDAKFAAQDTRIDAKFAAQDTRIDAKFAEERQYIRQIVREELAEIRVHLDNIEQRLENDTLAALDEIEVLKNRLTKLELKVAKLAPA